MVAAAVAASCAFMLPVATPPNAEVFGSGYLKISDMFNKGKFDNVPGGVLIILTLLTALSRKAIRCKELNAIIFNLLRGAIIGVLFYYFFSDYYKNTEKGFYEKESCDLGYKNYKCDTIGRNKSGLTPCNVFDKCNTG